jgi:hypothetical protein
MMKNRAVQLMQVVFLVGVIVWGGLAAQSYAQGAAQESKEGARQALSVPEIVDVLVSFPRWDIAQLLPTGPCPRAGTWQEIVLKRQGTNEVKALSAYLYSPERVSYQILKVAGPLVHYVTTVNVCDASANRADGGCDSLVEWTIEVVSKSRVNLKMNVLRGGSGAGVVTGQKCSTSFIKK